MAPTVTVPRSSPMVAVSIPSLDLIAGSLGPHVETAIPPSPNAAVTLQRQRTIIELVTASSKLFTAPRLITDSVQTIV
jgi:hypothetical protein